MSVHVDHDSAVPMPPADGEVIDAYDRDLARHRVGQGPDEAQKAAAPDWQAKTGS
jgi:hypothetical protein